MAKRRIELMTDEELILECIRESDDIVKVVFKQLKETEYLSNLKNEIRRRSGEVGTEHYVTMFTKISERLNRTENKELH